MQMKVKVQKSLCFVSQEPRVHRNPNSACTFNVLSQTDHIIKSIWSDAIFTMQMKVKVQARLCIVFQQHLIQTLSNFEYAYKISKSVCQGNNAIFRVILGLQKLYVYLSQFLGFFQPKCLKRKKAISTTCPNISNFIVFQSQIKKEAKNCYVPVL